MHYIFVFISWVLLRLGDSIFAFRLGIIWESVILHFTFDKRVETGESDEERSFSDTSDVVTLFARAIKGFLSSQGHWIASGRCLDAFLNI